MLKRKVKEGENEPVGLLKVPILQLVVLSRKAPTVPTESTEAAVRLEERRAAQTAGALLVALAGLAVLTSILSLLGYREPRRSLIGIVILLAAAVAMPVLASRKRKLPAA